MRGAPKPQLAAIATYLNHSDEQLTSYVDSAHHTFLDTYLQRADARWSRGDSSEAVVRELWGAARCYAAHGPMYLTKWPVHRLRARRLDPLELALITGDPAVISAVAEHVAVDPMVVIAGLAEGALAEELGALTSALDTRHAQDPSDLAGALAVLYWLALSAMVRGEASALRAVQVTSRDLVTNSPEMLSTPSGGLARLAAVHKVLAHCHTQGDAEALVAALVSHGQLHAELRKHRAAEDVDVRRLGSQSLDRTAMALALIAASSGPDIEGQLSAHKMPELMAPRAALSLED